MIIYVPEIGLLKIPTANSAQSKKNKIKTAIRMAILYFGLIFLIIISMLNPVAINITPISIKSIKLQLISIVNCIAINGSNKSISVIKIIFF